jgi:hypothetical protein
MDFNHFSELIQFIRRYNSKSVLETGTQKCWQIWESPHSNPHEWLIANGQLNYALRIVLLSSQGNPHRNLSMDTHTFDRLLNDYYSWSGHTISDNKILDNEATVLLDSIKKYEDDNQRQVRNWSVKLSKILDQNIVRSHVAILYLQRLAAFQNSGFGHPLSRLHRTIKFIELLDERCKEDLSETFLSQVGLSIENYFRQFLACLLLFGEQSHKKGFCDFSKFPDIGSQLQQSGITPNNIKLFVEYNSAPHHLNKDNSFRKKVSKTLNDVAEYYQPFLYNHFLEVPFIKLNDNEFCLPDPLSFTESCWNQTRNIISSVCGNRSTDQSLSSSFESYLENILLPFICGSSFERITEVKSPNSNQDKRADFIISTPRSYIVLECKNSVMSADTSACFHADKLADLWCRIHSAYEQIGMTVKALKLDDKPVIPLILTFYDSIAASTVFEQMLKQTDYCSLMGLSMPPIVRSLHEFEHWISDRSINNWSELILANQNNNPSVEPDNKGHRYGHLSNINILQNIN